MTSNSKLIMPLGLFLAAFCLISWHLPGETEDQQMLQYSVQLTYLHFSWASWPLSSWKLQTLISVSPVLWDRQKNFSLRSSIETHRTALWDLTHWDLTQWEQSCVNMFNTFKIDLLIPLTNSSSGFLKEIVYNKKLLLFLKKRTYFTFLVIS